MQWAVVEPWHLRKPPVAANKSQSVSGSGQIEILSPEMLRHILFL